MAVRVRLNDLSSSDINKINAELRHVPKVRGRNGRAIDGSAVYLSREKGKYLSIPLAYGIKNDHTINEGKKNKLKFTNTLRENQVEPIKECLEQLEEFNTTFIDLNTGYGKTVIGAYVACKLKGVTVVLIANTDLIKQWVATFKKFTNASIHVFDTKKPDAYDGEDVIIMMRLRTKKMPGYFSRIVKFMIVDEVDTFLCKEGLNAIMRFFPCYLMFQSATPKKANGLHSMYLDFIGEHKVWRPRTKPFTLITYYTGIDIIRKNDKNGDVIWSEVVDDLAYDKKRNKKIIKYARDNHRKCTLIFSKLIEHAIALADACNKFSDADYIAGTKKKFVKAQYYAATFSKIARGFDLASQLGEDINIDHAIFAHTVADEGLLEQSIGRAMRSKRPRITMFTDNDRSIHKHSDNAIKWCMANSCKRHVIIPAD